MKDDTTKTFQFFNHDAIYRTIFDNSPDPILLYDLTGNIINTTGSMEKLLGYSKDELRTMNFGALLRPGAFESMVKVLVNILDEDMADYETLIIRKDGREFPANISSSLVNIGDNSIIQNIICDISQQKNFNAILRQSEEKFGTFFQKNPDFCLILSPEGVVLDANKLLLDFLGCNKWDVSGLMAGKLFVENQRDAISGIIRRIVGIESVDNEEVTIKNVRGAIRQVLLRAVPIIRNGGEVLYLLFVMRDITELVKAQDDLKKTSRRLDLAIAASNIGLWDWNVMDQTIHFSRKMKEQLGISGGPHVHPFEKFISMVHPGDKGRVKGYFGDYLNDTIKIFDTEFRILHENGTYRWIYSHAEKIFENGIASRVTGCCIDITKRKNTELFQLLFVKILQHLNSPLPVDEIISRILAALMQFTGFQAVGLRLQSGEDYPYYRALGFPGEFLEKENSLVCGVSGSGPVLRCLCGAVIGSGSCPANSCLTSYGTFWTNSLGALFSSGAAPGGGDEAGPACRENGYSSMALVPVKIDGRTVGLLQLNEGRENMLDGDLIDYFEQISESIGIALGRKEWEEKIRASLREKETMLREIHHRVKNNLQVISSMLSLQKDYFRDEADIRLFADSENRIRSMAHLHEYLYQSDNFSEIDFSDFMNVIIDELTDSYEVEAGKIAINNRSQRVLLDLNRAVPLAQIVTELISNSMKYAFPGDRKGRIDIEFCEGGDGGYSLFYSDNGCGPREDFHFPGDKTLGLTLVDIFVKQLKGDISVSTEKGIAYRIYF